MRLASEGDGFNMDQRLPWRSGVYCVMVQCGASGRLLVHKCDYCMSFPTEGSLKQSEIAVHLCCESSVSVVFKENGPQRELPY